MHQTTRLFRNTVTTRISWTSIVRSTQHKQPVFAPDSHSGALAQTSMVTRLFSSKQHPSAAQIPAPTTKSILMATPTRSAEVHTHIPTKIAFISGPLEPDTGYFETYYLPLIDFAISGGHQFVLAASKGIDAEAQAYLLRRIPAWRVTIYLREAERLRMKAHLRAFEQAGGRVVVAGRNHTERDEALTKASHYDILRYRTDEECHALYGKAYRRRVSGTEKNEIRRKAGMGLIWIEPKAANVPIAADIVSS